MSERPVTLGGVLLRSVAMFQARPAMRFHENGKSRMITYEQLGMSIHAYASHLHRLGLRRADTMVILAENSKDWAILDWAAQTLGVVTVPIYTTLPADQASYIATDSGATLAVTSGAALSDRISGVPGLRTIQLSEFSAEVAEPGLTPEEWREIAASPCPDDLATIIYTSGTTGPPKGAELTTGSLAAVVNNVQPQLPVDDNDVFLSFLPLSHVYERVAGHFLPITVGACIAYSQGAARLAAEMKEYRPTIMLCVPRLLETLRLRINDSVSKESPFKQWLFHLAFRHGLARAKGQFAPLSGLLDSIVGKKIRERMGGKIRFFVSGGAALPAHVADFFGAFRLTVLQGYGLTETCGANCVNHPDRNDPTTIGEPVGGVEMQIARDGEILIRGACRMRGYHNHPEATAQVIDEEGWFHTGDIGEKIGHRIKITDRKKDILVLGNGKNVAPQPIENRLRERAYISEAVLVGDGMDHVSALIVPDFERLLHDHPEHVKDRVEPEELVLEAWLQALVRKDVDAVNKELADFERVKRHALLARGFSIESGELTPTLKVKRKVIMERYVQLIQGMQKSAAGDRS